MNSLVCILRFFYYLRIIQIVSDLIHFKIMSTIVSLNIILVLCKYYFSVVVFSAFWIPNIDSEHILLH